MQNDKKEGVKCKKLAIKHLYKLKYHLENVVASADKYDDMRQDKIDLKEVDKAFSWLVNLEL